MSPNFTIHDPTNIGDGHAVPIGNRSTHFTSPIRFSNLDNLSIRQLCHRMLRPMLVPPASNHVCHILEVCPLYDVRRVDAFWHIARVATTRNGPSAIGKIKCQTMRGNDSPAIGATAITLNANSASEWPYEAAGTDVIFDGLNEPLMVGHSGRLGLHLALHESVGWAGSLWRAVARLSILPPSSFFGTFLCCLSQIPELASKWRDCAA
jgi:hypothetical protein